MISSYIQGVILAMNNDMITSPLPYHIHSLECISLLSYHTICLNYWRMTTMKLYMMQYGSDDEDHTGHNIGDDDE